MWTHAHCRIFISVGTGGLFYLFGSPWKLLCPDRVLVVSAAALLDASSPRGRHRPRGLAAYGSKRR